MDKRSANKFHTNFTFVKPLYKKNRKYNRENVDKIDILNFDRTVKLCGNDFNVKTVVVKDGEVNNVKRKVNKEYKIVLPGVCDSIDNVNGFKYNKIIGFRTEQISDISDDKKTANSENLRDKMLEHKESRKQEETELNDDCDERYSKNIDGQITSAMVMANKETDRWLRVYPAPNLPEQSVYSTIMRCILCQLGLFSFLVLWTMIAVFVIESFE
ncbi:hypothetical protein KGM_205440A, partial [Danaus plexippus plexippus]